jgi:SAM-dependent methyltransferase
MANAMQQTMSNLTALTPSCCETSADCAVKPAEQPAVETSSRAWPWWVQGLEYGLYQSQALCLEKIKTPPRRIVIIGGCRQRQLAEYLAFRYPDSKIALLDPDLAQVAQAKADIHCRFHFMHASPEQLPLPDDSVDLVIAHQLMDYVTDWSAASLELARITKGHLLLSLALPMRQRLIGCLPHTRDWLALNGFIQQAPLRTTPTPDWNATLKGVLSHGRVLKYIEPMPWRMILVEQHPVKEDRLVLV